MKASLFSPILILLIITLFIKASSLFGRIQEQTSYALDTSATSMLVNTAYAGGHKKKAPPPEPKKMLPAMPKKAKKSTGTSMVNNLTRSEVNLLKELSKRRDKIDKEKKALKLREQVLKETENKIDKKVTELQALQSQLEALMKKYEKKEHGKILSLVKIYETMKPKDAAKIFNELEMPVLLRLVSNMKEVRVAPVIAGMNPSKARELSIELAKQKPIE
ncbi:MAG: hypothetical protein COA94_01910 [Rickettsiales bacterium]|nr:MAG: hypothetical protein COA94_01910 [Rickettsiales bacterium]